MVSQFFKHFKILQITYTQCTIQICLRLNTMVQLHKHIFMAVLICSPLQKKAVSPSTYFPHGLKVVPLTFKLG